MKKKSIISSILVGAVAVTALVGLTGCAGDPPHSHTYGQDIYYQVSSDNSKAYTFRKCSCGHDSDPVEMAAGSYVIANADSTSRNYAQKVLNSNINNKTVVFAPGEYNQVLELSPSRETAIIYDAILNGTLPTGEPSTTIVSLNDVVENKYYIYERNYENITFAGTEGAVFKNRVLMYTGNARGYNSVSENLPERYDPIKDDYNWPVGMTANEAFYMLQNYENLNFVNMDFEGSKGRIHFHNGYSYVKKAENLLVKNCTFVTDTPHHSTSPTQGSSWDAAIRIGTTCSYPYSTTTGYDKTQSLVISKNVVIENNMVDKHFIGIYVQATDGIKIKNNIVKNTEDVGISVQPSGSGSSFGTIQIENNSVDTTSNRAIRIANCSNATINVVNNAFANIVTLDDANSVVKASSLNGCTFTFENNTVDGDSMEPNADKTLSAYNFKKVEVAE